MESIPIKSGKRQDDCLTTIQHSVRSPSHSNLIENEIKDIKIKKEEVKLLLLVYTIDMIPYIENPRDAKQKLFRLIHKFNKATGYNINIQKSVALLYTNNEISESEC